MISSIVGGVDFNKVPDKKERKKRRKSSFFEWEELASYTPIAKPFLHNHFSAFSST